MWALGVCELLDEVGAGYCQVRGTVSNVGALISLNN